MIQFGSLTFYQYKGKLMDIIISDEEDIDYLYGDVPKIMTAYRKSIADQLTLCIQRRYEVQSGVISPEAGLPAFLSMMECAGNVRRGSDVNDFVEDNPDDLFVKLNELNSELEKLMMDGYIITGSSEIVRRLRNSLHIPIDTYADLEEVPVKNVAIFALVVAIVVAAICGIDKLFDR